MICQKCNLPYHPCCSECIKRMAGFTTQREFIAGMLEEMSITLFSQASKNRLSAIRAKDKDALRRSDKDYNLAKMLSHFAELVRLD